MRPQEDARLPGGRSQTSPLTPLLLRSTGLRPSGAGSGSPRPPRTTPGVENSSNPTDTGHGGACTGVFNARAFGEPPAPGRAPGRGSNTSTKGGTGSATSPQWSHTGSPDPIETPIVPHRDPRPPNGPTQGPCTWLPDPTGTPDTLGTPGGITQGPKTPHRESRPPRDPTRTPSPTGTPHRTPDPPENPGDPTQRPYTPPGTPTGNPDSTGTPGGPILGPQTLQEPPGPSHRDLRPHKDPTQHPRPPGDPILGPQTIQGPSGPPHRTPDPPGIPGDLPQ